MKRIVSRVINITDKCYVKAKHDQKTDLSVRT